MSPYVRLLDLLATHLEPDHALDEVANDPQLAPMAIFLPRTPQPRDWFHNLFQQARSRDWLEPLRSLLEQLSGPVSPELADLWQLAFAQPEVVMRQSDRKEVTTGRFSLVLDTPLVGLHLSQLDAWLKGLIDSGTVGDLSIHGIQQGGTAQQPITHVDFATTNRDYVVLWSQAGSGHLSHLGPHWILAVGDWHSASSNDEELEDTLVPKGTGQAPRAAETTWPAEHPPAARAAGPRGTRPKPRPTPAPREEPTGFWDRISQLGQRMGLGVPNS